MKDKMYFENLDWKTISTRHKNSEYDISEYHKILCPKSDYPKFLEKYIALPIVQRLKGIGLLCGTDWTELYKNRFYYSRFDHSVGVALIIWHFTHDKAQTLAGLFHDIATPVFSHVSDFRKGDALTQTLTEEPTSQILRNSKDLESLLFDDRLTFEQIEDYHIYPIADNEIPCLSADRLEYMFPSGMVLDGSWTMEEIRQCYEDIEILKNEDGKDELGFKTLETAELYCEHFCLIGHMLQLNEDKLTLHLLGQIMNLAVKTGILLEDDFMTKSEREIIQKLDAIFLDAEKLTNDSSSNSPKTSFDESCNCADDVELTNVSLLKSGRTKTDEKYKLSRLYKTFRFMNEILHTEQPLSEDEFFCVSLKVKQRYINPLVKISCDGKIFAKRLSDVSEKSKKIIEEFLSYTDTAYGCVKLL